MSNAARSAWRFWKRKERQHLPPVIFLIFNRPEATRRSFEAIRAARPSQLLIVADGPRSDCIGEQELCAEVRRVVARIDWPCKVWREFADHNLGCGFRVASGLCWAFQKVTEAIIIEDDCVPDLSFFRFSAELLEKYRNDDRIMMISGNNFQNGVRRAESSYYFSRLPHCWGWATWRRAWAGYDFEMKEWGQRRESGWLSSKFSHPPLVRSLQGYFDTLWMGKLDTWDYQWMYHMLSHDGLSVVPEQNLVENVGFGPDATHTKLADHRYLLKSSVLPFPLKHPEIFDVCREADEFEISYLYR